MNKIPLIGGSICAVVLLVLASLTNVVGFQTVQFSNQKMINSEIDQKELLFQTIIDMANNKEIQKIILESLEEKLFSSLTKTPPISFPTLTKNKLNVLYNRGMFLSKTMSKTRINSLLEHPIMSTPTKEKIDSIIRNNTRLADEITKLSALNCPCSQTEGNWTFPIICSILFCIYFPTAVLALLLILAGPYWYGIYLIIAWIIVIPCIIINDICSIIGLIFGCWWDHG